MVTHGIKYKQNCNRKKIRMQTFKTRAKFKFAHCPCMVHRAHFIVSYAKFSVIFHENENPAVFSKKREIETHIEH